jgi:AhpD family alkylhydroperoxidase
VGVTDSLSCQTVAKSVLSQTFEDASRPRDASPTEAQPTTQEAIALAVGNADDCSYCQAAHTGGGKAAGLADDEMISIRQDAVEFDTKLAALLTLAREYTTNVGAVDDATWQSALDAGWTEEDLTELSVHVPLNLFTNYFNHFVQTDLDLPAAPTL